MKSIMNTHTFVSYSILGTPYTIIEVSHPVYSSTKEKFEIFYDFWLNHKEYGYMMHMFGVTGSDFHAMFDDMDMDSLNRYIYMYIDDINKLEEGEMFDK